MFMLYIIRSKLGLNGFIFVSNINIINNPGLVLSLTYMLYFMLLKLKLTKH